eukprot:gene761-biopygen510
MIVIGADATGACEKFPSHVPCAFVNIPMGEIVQIFSLSGDGTFKTGATLELKIGDEHTWHAVDALRRDMIKKWFDVDEAVFLPPRTITVLVPRYTTIYDTSDAGEGTCSLSCTTGDTPLHVGDRIGLKKKLKCLDLFSGIGGNALALRSICKTIAYCEIDPFARDVLEANMKRKNLDKAPIFEDVTTLKAVDVPELPDVITASFPCQDISFAGKGAGITGEHSGLYKHIFRLVKEFRRHRNHRISVIVMENWPMIKHRGLEKIESDLRSLGFRFQSVYRKASDFGARHERRRWCMVAIDKQSDLDLPCTYFRHNFDNLDNIPVLLKREGKASANYIRYGALGNAVVPKFIASVWDELICSVPFDSQDINRRIIRT